MNPVLREATAADGPVLLEIERECFASPNWSVDDILRYRCTVAEVDGQIAGFLSSREVSPSSDGMPAEREILNIAVRVVYRGLGIAKALLKNELETPATYFLEVRESNLAARQLYASLGFTVAGHRANYYSHPCEAAIVMHMK
ncbi:MAG: GNAT family N-acetyltransferase [Acidobacteriaceae bacterium]|nr:GNAT family N-acetyltransferase [Acidobacteriaceae bacterium]